MKKKLIINEVTGNKGFFLIDILIAICLLSIGLVPILGMFIQSTKLDTMAKNYTVGANLAQKQLELLKIHPQNYWNELILPGTIPWQDTEQPPLPPYVITTTGIPLANAPLVQVTVIVCWQEGGKDCSLQFLTFYSKI